MINKLLKEAIKEKLELEVYVIKNNEITIEYQNDELINYKTQDIKEYRLKALIDGVAVTITVLDISNPKEIIQLLKAARELVDEKDQDSLAEQIEIDALCRNENNVDIQTIKNNIKELNIELKQKYPEIFSIRTEYNFESDNYEIYNTNKVELKDYNYHHFYYADLVLKTDNKNICCDKYIMAKEIDFEEFKKMVEDAILESLKRKEPKSVVTNKYNVILNNQCVYNILNAFAPDFLAKNISNRQSAFTDKLSKKIFSDKITIVEDPTNQNLIGTRQFDSEGTKTYYKLVVDKGVFTTELYNKKYAEKDNTKSTGNSYGVRNLYIKPGNSDKKELLKTLNNGVYIDKLMGIHSAINHLTGDISIQCEGFLVENGEKTTALNQMIMSTNIFELLTQVKVVGSDLEFFGSNGGAPSLLVENITIAGKEV